MKVQDLRGEIQKGLDSGTITGEQHHDRFAQKRAAALEARGDEKIPLKKKENMLHVLDIFTAMPDDFMEEGRSDPPPQQRDFEQ